MVTKWWQELCKRVACAVNFYGFSQVGCKECGGGCEGQGMQESNGLLVVEAVVAVESPSWSGNGKKNPLSQQQCTQNNCGPTAWLQAV
jgi:hypothetical protein